MADFVEPGVNMAELLMLCGVIRLCGATRGMADALAGMLWKRT